MKTKMPSLTPELKIGTSYRIKDKSLLRIMLGPAVMLLLLLSIFPLAYSIWISLHDWVLPNKLSNSTFSGIQNYITILKDGQFWGSIGKTFIFVGASVSLELIIGIGAALILNQAFFGSKLLQTIMLIATFTSSIVVGTLWRMIMNPSIGLLNYYLGKLGIEGPDWLGSNTWSLISVTLVNVWQWMPFVMIVAVAALATLPTEPFEAADLDGANRFQKFLHITLPLIKSSLLVIILIRIMDSFREFTIIFSMTKGGPGVSSETVTILNYNIFSYNQIALSATIAIISTFIVIVIINYLVNKVGNEVWHEK
jgi:multiple sugar transport system permease protein